VDPALRPDGGIRFPGMARGRQRSRDQAGAQDLRHPVDTEHIVVAGFLWPPLAPVRPNSHCGLVGGDTLDHKEFLEDLRAGRLAYAALSFMGQLRLGP